MTHLKIDKQYTDYQSYLRSIFTAAVFQDKSKRWEVVFQCRVVFRERKLRGVGTTESELLIEGAHGYRSCLIAASWWQPWRTYRLQYVESKAADKSCRAYDRKKSKYRLSTPWTSWFGAVRIKDEALGDELLFRFALCFGGAYPSHVQPVLRHLRQFGFVSSQFTCRILEKSLVQR